MPLIAIVTGSPRRICAAASKRLEDAGHGVVSDCGGTAGIAGSTISAKGGQFFV